jgi:alpha-N-arabinofuranosidase
VSYESGPHDGFIEFYNAMKAMNPSAQVCESEGLDATFMEIAGSEDPYDCVVMHGYMPAPSPGLPLATYEQDLMSVPVADTYYLVNLQEAARYYSGHDVPVVMTEYGQPVWPPPDGDVSWNLSMGEALLTAAQVMEWAYHGVALAEKQLAVSEPFDGALRDADLAEELSATNGVIADVGPRFLVEPPGLALGLLSKLAGGELLPVSMSNDPYIGTPTPAFMGGQYATEVWAIAAQAGQQLFVALVNASPDRAVLTQLDLPISAGPHQATVWSLNGAALASYNSPARPNQVEVVRTETVIPGPVVTRELPAHSVNVLMLQA